MFIDHIIKQSHVMTIPPSYTELELIPPEEPKLKMTNGLAELELMGAPEDVAGKIKLFFELLNNAWEEITIPDDGLNVKLELTIGLEEDLKVDSVDCSTEVRLEVFVDCWNEHDDSFAEKVDELIVDFVE